MGTNFSICLSFILYLFLILPLISSLDYTNLIYKGCANQKIQDPSGSYSQTLNTLFETLITQSSKTNFTKTQQGETNKDSIIGLYQCRGDLNMDDCNKCVSHFPKLAKKLCGDQVIAVRIQLVGCYMKYEIMGFKQVSSVELLYKYCKGKMVVDIGFEGKRDNAFEQVVKGVSDGNGFYASSYEFVYVMGQCEGDLVGSECSECVKSGLERVNSECGDSMLGQIYLNQCYVSYSYYPDGVGGDEKDSSPGTKHNTSKTTAIVVGATAAVGFGVVILLFIKSALKKKTTKYQYGGYGG